ncbi:MAG: 4-diphosphocytidyl-2-C-methyl-D-erythritol kinase [Verrucomicrobiota bacterium]
MQIFAPAKVNLSLRILDRRPDGFHEIETFITPISLSDELNIAKRSNGEGIKFQCADASIPLGEENLVIRAARLFFEMTGSESSLSIDLVKNIPHGAGLGGGSSDAAATLLALNQLFDTKLPREALAKMGSIIGSDVPFFIFESAALCRGRGELVSPQKLREGLTLVLFKPEFGVPTAWAYSRWHDSREIPDVVYGPQDFHGHRFLNDLERPVFEKFVFLAQLKSWLMKQPEVSVALMSGSGSTVFGVLNEHDVGDAVVDRARKELDPKLWTCVCRTR